MKKVRALLSPGTKQTVRNSEVSLLSGCPSNGVGLHLEKSGGSSFSSSRTPLHQKKGLPRVFHLCSVLFLFKSKLGYVYSVDCQKKEIGALCITLAFWKADHLKISRSETLSCRQRFKRDTNHFLIPQTPLRSNTKYTTVHGDIFCWVFLYSQICTGPESIFKPFVPFLKNKIVFRTRKTQAKGRSNLICHSRE